MRKLLLFLVMSAILSGCCDKYAGDHVERITVSKRWIVGGNEGYIELSDGSHAAVCSAYTGNINTRALLEMLDPGGTYDVLMDGPVNISLDQKVILKMVRRDDSNTLSEEEEEE